MKATRIINRTAAALLLLGAVACNEAFEVPEGVEVVVSDKHIYLSASVYYGSYGKESFSAYGDEGEFRISSDGDSWVISDIPDWVSIERTSGTGYAGDIPMTVEPNYSASPRVAVLSVTAEGFYVKHCTVVQKGVDPYISDAEEIYSTIYRNVPAKAGSYTYALDTNVPSEDIEVSVDVDWITGAQVQDSGLVFTVEANSSTSSRYYGLIKLSYNDKVYLTYAITQNGVSASLSTYSYDVEPAGGTHRVGVDSNTDWYAVVRESDESWMSVKYISANQFEVTVTANKTTRTRYGEVYIRTLEKDGSAGTILTTMSIKQAGLSLSLGTAEEDINASGTNSVTVTVTSNSDWVVSNLSQDWLTASPLSGSGNGTITFRSKSANPDYMKRYATATVTIAGTDLSETVGIAQKAKTQGVDATTLEMPWKASSRELQLNIAGSWQAAISESWIHLDRTHGDGSATLNVSVDRNDGMEARTGYITLASINQTFTITVNQQSQYFTLDSTTGTITALGGSINLSVSSSIGSQAEMWSSADDHTAPEWVSISNTSGNSYTITAAANPSGLPRTAVAAFTPTEEEAADSFRQGLLFNVTQEGRRLAANVTSIDVTRNGGTTETYTLTVDGEFSIEKGADDFWYMLVTDGAAFRLVVTPNTGEENRTGAVTIRLLGTPDGEESTLTIPVVQYGKGANIGIGGFGPDEDWTIKAYKR